MCRISHNFNLLSLYPKTKEDRDNFWAFRCVDIGRMIYVQFAFGLLWTIQYASETVYKPEEHSLIQSLALFVVIAVSIVILVARKHFDKHWVYLLIVFSAALNAFVIFGAVKELDATDDPDERLHVLDIWIFIILENSCLCSFFLSPSIRFLLFGYVPTFVLAINFLIFKYGDFADEAFVSYAASLPVYGFIIVGMFYVLQYRELLRFFELK